MKKIILFVLMVTLLCGCQNQQEIESVDEVTQTTESIIEVVEVTEEIEVTEPVVTEEVTEPTEAFKEFEYFSKDVYYDYEYIDSGELIPHALFTPSTVGDYEKLPLILWLHGSGEKNTEPIDLQCSGLPKILTLWDFAHMEGFNAYVVAPHLASGSFFSPFWCTEDSKTNVKNLLDYYIENYNIDPDKVVACGHSLGGQGTLYFSQVLPEYFCAMAPLSVYNPCTPIVNTEIPTWCFEGRKEYGEDSNSYDYAYSDFKHKFGEECLTSLPVGHGGLPAAVFAMDENNNSRTDLLEWFVEHMEK